MSTLAKDITLSKQIDRLEITALKVKAERDKFYDALDNVLSAIQDSRGALNNYSDIDSEGRANWAMALLQLADKYEEIL